jgi:hypothetical protein
MCQAKMVALVVRVVEQVEIPQQVVQVELEQPHQFKVLLVAQTHQMQMLAQAEVVEQVQ